MTLIGNWLSGANGLPPLAWWSEGTGVAMALGLALLATAVATASERERPAADRQQPAEPLVTHAEQDTRLPDAA
jgi:hypothetical protein